MFILALASAGAIFAGCSGSSTRGAGGNAGTTGTATATDTAGSTTAGETSTTIETTTTGTGGAGGQGGNATTTSSVTTTGVGGGGAGSCGGSMGNVCAADEYCDYANNLCGLSNKTGVCTARPQACPDLDVPNCACDGSVYPSPCDAAAAGFDVFDEGGCMPPAGFFQCGSGFCVSKKQYCQRTLASAANTPNEYLCIDVPVQCGEAPTCACLSSQPCADSCVGFSGFGFLLTCP